MKAQASVAPETKQSQGLLEQIMAQTRIEPTHEGYAVAERGSRHSSAKF